MIAKNPIANKGITPLSPKVKKCWMDPAGQAPGVRGSDQQTSQGKGILFKKMGGRVAKK
jgi:hypothetical protein